jgi:tetratricopeptide (TPR) repeat protein
MKRIQYFIITSVLALTSLAVQAQSIDEGRRLTRNEQYEDAEKVFSSLITASPKKGEFYYWAGINYLEQGDTVSAGKSFDAGLLAAPKVLLNNVGKGHLLLRAGKTAEAQALFDLALKTKKKSQALIHREIARAYLMVTDRSKATLVAYATKALSHLDKAKQDDYEVLLLQGDAFFAEKPEDGTRAVNKYIFAGYNDATSPIPLLREAMIYQKVKNLDIAMIRVDEALAKDANFAPGYRQKAELFTDMKKRDSAVLYFREYLKRNNNLSARRKFVSALYLNGEFDECIRESKELLKLKEFSNIYGVIAYAIVEKNDTSKALNREGLEYFELYEAKHVKAANRVLSPNESFYKGILLFRTGQKEVAWSLHKQVLSDTASAIVKWYDRAREMYYQSKDYAQVVEILNLKAIKNKSLPASDLYPMAMAYRYLENYTKSNEYFKEIVLKDSTYKRGYYYIALNQHMMDPMDSTGTVSAAYLNWINKLNAEEKTKNRSDITRIYGYLAGFGDAKAGKAYASVEDKALGYAKTIEYYKNAIGWYKILLEMNPDDEATKEAIATREKFVTSLEKRKKK